MTRHNANPPHSTTGTGRFQVLPDLQHRVLRREFADFFKHMTTTEPGWPATSHEAFVDALADSLLLTGERHGLGISFLETLTIELQERLEAVRNGDIFWPNPATRLGNPQPGALCRTFQGAIYWDADDDHQNGEVTRATWVPDGLLIEGFGRLADSSRFQFAARLSCSGNKYEGTAECSMSESRESWQADITLSASKFADELEGVWREGTASGEVVNWDMTIELRAAEFR